MLSREEFEEALVREDVVRYFLSKTPEELKEELGEEVARMVGYEQKNIHHCYDLWEHTLRTVEGINPEGLTPEQFKNLRVAAFFHDIGKPDVSSFNEKTGQQVFYGHATHSVEVADPILEALGYTKEEKEKIEFYIGHHDDFISYRTQLAPWMKTHEYIRDITPETVAEKIFENKYYFEKMYEPNYFSGGRPGAYNKDQVRYICYTLGHHGEEPQFTNINGPLDIQVDMQYLGQNIKYNEIFRFGYQPTEEDYRMLLEICKADAGAQSEVVIQNGKEIASRKSKIDSFLKIGDVLSEACQIEEEWKRNFDRPYKDRAHKADRECLISLIKTKQNKNLIEGKETNIEDTASKELYRSLYDDKRTLAEPEGYDRINASKENGKYEIIYVGQGYDFRGYHQVGAWGVYEIEEQQLEKVEAILKKIEETKTVVTHFGDDLDNKSAVYALERFAVQCGVLEEGEHLTVERVPAGQVKEGFLNVDTGGHKGSRFDDDTFVIDGNPAEGVHSASAEIANLGIYVPQQIIELADVIPNKVSPLESRTALSLIRSANGEQIFEIAEAGLLDRALTDEQLEKYGLVEAQKKQQAIIDNAVQKVNAYTKELVTGEKVVIAPEQILGGAQIAYELGASYYASVQPHKSGKGSTFAVTSKPGVELPESIKKFGQTLVEKYKNPDGSSGVFLNPNGQMLVAGGFKNPDFAVEQEPEELMEELNNQFKEYELAKSKENIYNYSQLCESFINQNAEEVFRKYRASIEFLKENNSTNLKVDEIISLLEISKEELQQDYFKGGENNPEFQYHWNEFQDKLNTLTHENQVSKMELTPEKIAEGISPRKGEVEEVIEETAQVARQEVEKETKDGQTQSDE